MEVHRRLAEGVYRAAVLPNFIVQMGTGRTSGGADQSEHLAPGDLLSRAHENTRQVCEACLEPVAVSNRDQQAVASVPVRKRYYSVRRCDDG